MPMSVPDLDRFVAAQDKVMGDIAAELATGRKASHWVWFVFPQLAGLGSSPTAQFYALAGLDEARAWLAHPVLGPRLREHVRLMLRHRDRSAHAILGSPDDMKFRSCLTLFEAAASHPGDRELFSEALAAFYGGEPDKRTIALLRQP
jgi:uncharacterized protein (DUF1810 family)